MLISKSILSQISFFHNFNTSVFSFKNQRDFEHANQLLIFILYYEFVNYLIFIVAMGQTMLASGLPGTSDRSWYFKSLGRHSILVGYFPRFLRAYSFWCIKRNIGSCKFRNDQALWRCSSCHKPSRHRISAMFILKFLGDRVWLPCSIRISS